MDVEVDGVTKQGIVDTGATDSICASRLVKITNIFVLSRWAMGTMSIQKERRQFKWTWGLSS